MKLNRKRTSYSLYILSALMLSLFAACSTTSLSQETDSAMGQLPSGEEPAVAYGASLGEWEEATAAGSNADETDETAAGEIVSSDDEILFELDNVVYRQIMWDGLMPEDFTPLAVMGKYMDEIAAIEHGSSEMNELYDKIQEEMNNAPVNELLNEVEIRLPGFIAPLDYADDTITEFLLVPYFGACIHVPPPPVNQTVMVTVAEGHGINVRDLSKPFWVMGKIVTEGTTTDLAAAGYNITDAIIEPYTVSE